MLEERRQIVDADWAKANAAVLVTHGQAFYHLTRRSRPRWTAPSAHDTLALVPHGDDHFERLRVIVREDAMLMSLLRAVRSVALPDAYVAAGAVRDRVWDRLHDATPLPPRDVDVVFFDPTNDEARQKRAVATLEAAHPELTWDVVNQARVHHWYRGANGGPVPALRSTEEGIATWPETVTCLGVRLRDDDDLDVCAPHGLDDLFALRWRHHPARASVATFEQRLAKKRVAERWPRVVVVR